MRRKVKDVTEELLVRGGEGVRQAVESPLPYAHQPAADTASHSPNHRVGSIDLANGDNTGDASTGPSWPNPLDEAAFYGLAGEIVHAIEPHTEADPAALLLQFLIAFGNAVGHSPFFRVENTEHHMILFGVLVGATSKGRKGTSWDHDFNLLRSATTPLGDQGVTGGQEEWSTRVQEGLSSGEGLIWAVRDPSVSRAPIKERGRVKEYQDVQSDPGVSDKRLLVVETEFASVLKLATREGNTLSATMRRAWDRGDLRILNKNSPASATGAHISIIGHITKEDLRRHLEDTEAANGFGNRFIWMAVRRSKCLPEGGDISGVDFGPLVRRLREAIESAKRIGHMHRSEEARELWRSVYPDLSEGRPGLCGAIASRAEAQVLRLSCIYALLDKSSVVGQEHLEAALAVWRYAEASVRWIFGEALGDATADEILNALRASPEGLRRTEIRDIFARHKKACDIERALSLLSSLGLIVQTIEPSGDTGGRPAEVWRAV